jgi:hypothetical protein
VNDNQPRARLYPLMQLSRKLVAIWAVCGALLLFAIAWRGAIPGESWLLALAQYDKRIQEHVWSIGVTDLRSAIRLELAAWSVVAALMAGWWLAPEGFRAHWRPRIFQWSMTAGCSCALFILLVRAGSEEVWYPIGALMTNPAAEPIFGHRLLLVWLADGLKALHPSLKYIHAYYLSQIPIVILAVWIMGRWSALYIGTELRWIGQVLAVIMLAVTFDYLTFYDVGIVFFCTLCLFLLRKRFYAAFVAALVVGVLNHEIVMLLVAVAFLETHQKPKLCVSVCGAALVGIFGVRAGLQYAIPFHRHFDLRVWSNLYFPLFRPLLIAGSLGSLLFWWVAAALCWRAGDVFLKRAAVLFPLLLALTYAFGQFQEPRQFEALIPVVIGFILSHTASAWPPMSVEGAVKARVVDDFNAVGIRGSH